MNILDQILETKRNEVAASQKERSFQEIYAEALAVKRPTVSFSQALKNSPTGIIAEFKRRSPSKGFIKEGADIRTIVRGYAQNGASAISVLTDTDYFAGSLADLREARQVTDKPILRKDFIIDPYQICEAGIAGADTILLIAAALSPETCAELAAFAGSLSLEVLLELHDESELGYINPYVQTVGINNRNLATFVTDTAVSEHMAGLLPAGTVRISESGISDPETVLKLRKTGFRGFLMGENFMKHPNPGQALGEFIKGLEQ